MKWLCEHLCRQAGLLSEKPEWLIGIQEFWERRRGGGGLGVWEPGGMEYLRERGSGYVLRLRSRGLHVYTENRRKVSAMDRLRRLQAGEGRDMQPYYQREGEYRSVRLRAVRKDGDSERRGGKEVSEEARQWNRYIIVATSMGE